MEEEATGEATRELVRDGMRWAGGMEEGWKKRSGGGKLEVVGIEAVDVDDVARGVDASSARARLFGRETGG